MAFKATLLPVPVAPAIKRCGIFSSSATIGLPTISFPRHRGNSDFDLLNALEATISLNLTISRIALGISIPTTAFPGIGATIRILIARSAKARSSVRLTILFILTPDAGSYSNVVTTGPGVTAATLPLTPKSSNFFSSNFDCMRKFSPSVEAGRASGSSNRFTDGS